MIGFIDYRAVKNLSIIGYIFFVLALVFVGLKGQMIMGAKRWIDLGFWQLQPSELIKIFLISTLAIILQNEKKYQFKILLKIVIYSAIPIALVLIQPDLGTASVLIVIALNALFFAKIPKKTWVMIIIIFIVSGFFGYSSLKPYQKNRIDTFLNPQKDIKGSSYNINQSKIAIGSGGLLGRGLGRGSQSQLNFLPVAYADFVFAGMAESYGFVGSLIYLCLYLLMLYQIIKIIQITPDKYSHFFASSIFIIFLYQAFVNISGNLGLVPITGITLPFTSYGGSSMLVMFILAGVLQSIYIRHKK